MIKKYIKISMCILLNSMVQIPIDAINSNNFENDTINYSYH